MGNETTEGQVSPQEMGAQPVSNPYEFDSAEIGKRMSFLLTATEELYGEIDALVTKAEGTYTSTIDFLKLRLESAETDGEAEEIDSLAAQALKQFREDFYAATKGYNSRKNCFLVFPNAFRWWP